MNRLTFYDWALISIVAIVVFLIIGLYGFVATAVPLVLIIGGVWGALRIIRVIKGDD